MGKGSNAQKNKRARENAEKRRKEQGVGGGGAAHAVAPLLRPERLVQRLTDGDRNILSRVVIIDP